MIVDHSGNSGLANFTIYVRQALENMFILWYMRGAPGLTRRGPGISPKYMST